MQRHARPKDRCSGNVGSSWPSLRLAIGFAGSVSVSVLCHVTCVAGPTVPGALISVSSAHTVLAPYVVMGRDA